MKLGVITTPWAIASDLSLPETFARIAAMGFHYVDILGLLNGDPLVLSEAQKQEAVDALQRHGLTPACFVLWPPGNVASADKAEQERCFEYIRAGIDFCAKLGARKVLFNAGQRVIGLDHRQAWLHSGSFMRRCADYALEQDVWILVESEPYVYYLVNDLATSVQMVREVDRPRFLTIVDLGHMSLSRESASALADAASIIGHIHITDNDGLLHANHIIGSGTTPVAEYLAAINASPAASYCAARNDELVAVMELGVRGDPIDSPERWVRESTAHVQEVAPFLTLN
jgi:sugar phosphate isomerase/epimerase